MHTREALKQGLKNHMERVEKSSHPSTDLLQNGDYRISACLLSIMDSQDGISIERQMEAAEMVVFPSFPKE